MPMEMVSQQSFASGPRLSRGSAVGAKLSAVAREPSLHLSLALTASSEGSGVYNVPPANRTHEDGHAKLQWRLEKKDAEQMGLWLGWGGGWGWGWGTI